MHLYNLDKWTHKHHFSDVDSESEKRIWRVIVLTFVMMIGEIFAGLIFGSMSLLADGWHMGTHAAALGIAAFAYWFARKNKDNVAFAFGTGKVGVLGGFASAIVLGVVAALMVVESIRRLISPVEIRFTEAIGVAFLGLTVNILCAFMLARHNYSHDHDDAYHQDHNLKAAYLHVIADAMTSVLAIVALTTGKFLGWNWMDPCIGILGAVVISVWAYGLIRSAGRILLDSDVSPQLLNKIKETIEADNDNKIVDLHVWKIDSNHFVALVSLVTHYPKDIDHYKRLLAGLTEIKHLTFEINKCLENPCMKIETG